MSADFLAAMENVLDLYAEPYDPHQPVVCFDETTAQLLADLRPSIPAAPGRPRRKDYEYLRAGDPQPVPYLRAPPGLAPSGYYPTAHHAGLRPAYEVAGG